MSKSNLLELSYYDPQAQTRLTAYADTLIYENSSEGKTISALRMGGYPEMVQAMADVIYSGATIEARSNDSTQLFQCIAKRYRRQLAHEGAYATATLMAMDDVQTAEDSSKEVEDEQEIMQPRKCYIFCPAGDRDRLFEELDRKTAAPLIPEFRDYVLDELSRRGDLRQMTVRSIQERMDAWVLFLEPEDRNVIEVLEDGLRSGRITVPGSAAGASDGFEEVESVTSYLNTFGVTVADRIRNQFTPLFDPAAEPLSDEVLFINDYIREKAGYSLYDAQLAVAEAVKRQLGRKGVALICAECGTGKSAKRS